MSRDKYITFKSFSPFQIIHISPQTQKHIFPCILQFFSNLSPFSLSFYPFPNFSLLFSLLLVFFSIIFSYFYFFSSLFLFLHSYLFPFFFLPLIPLLFPPPSSLPPFLFFSFGPHFPPLQGGERKTITPGKSES